MIKWFGRQGLVGQAGAGARPWSPADLFSNGEQGSFWGPLPYYSDAAGTVEADWGDPVGNIPDASGNGQDWTQVTSTARPILGRVPVGGRRNLLTWTEDFDNAVWVKSNSTVTANSAAAPDGTITADTIAFNGTVDARVERPVSIATQSTFSVWMRVSSGTASVSIGTRSANVVPVSVTDTWQRFSMTAADSAFPRIRCDTATSIYIWGAQLETGSAATPYQRVTTQYDITEAGVKGIHYLRFDGTDDDIPNTLPAIQGTIVLAGVNGIWIDELNFAGGAFSVGPDTYTGGPAGLMAILGDILERGCFVIDRALTPEEIAKVKGYYVARGSAGLIELGPELVTNGTFDTDLSGWVLATTGTSTGWVWDSGAASTNSSPEDKFVTMHQSGVLTTNDTYLVSADVQITSGTLRAYLGITASPPDVVWPNGGSKRNIATALNADSRFALNIPNGAVVSVDNVSCRRLIMPGETP